jgi:hypothetical protein
MGAMSVLAWEILFLVLLVIAGISMAWFAVYAILGLFRGQR